MFGDFRGHSFMFGECIQWYPLFPPILLVETFSTDLLLQGLMDFLPPRWREKGENHKVLIRLMVLQGGPLPAITTSIYNWGYNSYE